ncbi:hypothetical protein Q9233_013009 [Columba guinea]|nr:hypothetical protein Q9233_013009 [Columba guinea]
MARREAGASPVVRQIDQQFLVCSICLDRYRNPKTSILPERGVAALQNNFFITNLMEVLQRQPDGPHPARGGDPLSAVTGQPLCCPNHEGKVMEFYCEPCETAMCRECTAGEHREHRTVPLRDVLEQHKAALQQQLDAVLQAQLEALRQGQESILSSCAFAEQALRHGTAGEVLLVQKQMGERLGELAARAFPEHPHENAQLDLAVETDAVRRSILNLGALVTTSATAHQTVATGEGLRHAVYTPRAEGDFQLSVLLYGQPLRGSPFRVRAVRPCDVPPSPDDAKRRVKSPSGAHIRQKAVRRPSSMYSSGKKKENPIEDELIFRVFSNEGQFRLRFGVRGRSPGQLQRPTGVTVDTNGDIIVADYDNRWVSIFSPEGKFKSKIGAGRLLGPKGVAVDRNGHIIVVDNKACCVFIFQPSGKMVAKFGSRGTAERQFAGPHFVAVNNKNEIVVTDFHNHSVKVRGGDPALTPR